MEKFNVSELAKWRASGSCSDEEDLLAWALIELTSKGDFSSIFKGQKEANGLMAEVRLSINDVEVPISSLLRRLIECYDESVSDGVKKAMSERMEYIEDAFAAMRSAFNTKWGLQDDLPADHPYKASPPIHIG